MAVTKIWAIRDSVSRVVDYCTNPSKTKLSDLEQVLLYTAHGIGDEGDNLVAHGADIVAALHRFRHIVFAVKHAMHSHILVRNIRCQFVLQPVNVNENAVEFFFVPFELLEALFALGLPSSIFFRNQSSHMSDPLFVFCPQLGQDLLIAALPAGDAVKIPAG